MFISGFRGGQMPEFGKMFSANVEGLGQLAKWCLTGGQTHDVTQAVSLLEDICAGAVLADKAYDADEVLSKIENDGAKAVIPLKKKQKAAAGV